MKLFLGPTIIVLFLSLWECTAQTNYRRIASFEAAQTSGANPFGNLIEARDGKLYGTTYYGGTNDAGTVFRLNKDGSGLTLLHSFAGAPDEINPWAGVIEGSDGALYGTTSALELNTGAGTVFKLNKDGGGYLVLHRFTNVFEGRYPTAALLETSDGALYGTTAGGGIENATVFKLNKDGSDYAILHHFTGTNGDGAEPWGKLIEATDGRLYNTTFSGGAADRGAVFRIEKSGSNFMVLHSFTTETTDGARPYAAVLEGTDGMLYGTTFFGGSGAGGTVFRMNKEGTSYTILHHFTGIAGDGDSPFAALIETPDGSLIGTTYEGGTSEMGTIFKINKDGSDYSVLHRFGEKEGDGACPYAGLIAASDGAFYGATDDGGEFDFGAICRFSFAPAAVRIGNPSHNAAGIALHLTGGAAGQNYSIQSTTNLSSTNWQTLGSSQAGIDGAFDFFDSGTSNHPVQFYRSATP
jgi:uncharacterized repeat protein (TIGR03803 family)